MEIIKLEQGTEEWLKYRLWNLCASEAPMMMGASPHQSRNQLLALKKGWEANPVSSFTQKLYDSGHDGEAGARPITEDEYLLDKGSLLPLVGSRVVDTESGLILAASFDGLFITEGVLWEHKVWNEALAENVRNGMIEPQYYWQLEQQCLVSNLPKVHFTVSDGTVNKRVSFVYHSQVERRTQLIQGWIQFRTDLENYKLDARAEAVIPQNKTVVSVPKFNWDLSPANEVSTNLSAIIPILRDQSHIITTTPLENDQDFIDRAEVGKKVKVLRDNLTAEMERILAHFASLQVVRDEVLVADKILQKLQADCEKTVKVEKDRIKAEILSEAGASFGIYMTEQLARVSGSPIVVRLEGSHFTAPDLQGALKNKRTVDSMRASVDQAVADAKAKITPMVDGIAENLETELVRLEEYKYLFEADFTKLVMNEPQACTAIMDSRIREHNAEQDRKRAAEVARKEELRLQEEAAQKARDELKEQNRLLEEEKVRKNNAAVEEQNRINREAATTEGQKQDRDDDGDNFPPPETTKNMMEHIDTGSGSDEPARDIEPVPAVTREEDLSTKDFLLQNQPWLMKDLSDWKVSGKVTNKAYNALLEILRERIAP